MIENFNKIIKNKSFEKLESLTLIQRKNFLNEIVRSHDLMGLTFAHLIFLDCNFIDIDFRHRIFISCDFTNCKIFQSDLVRANFMESNFTDCHFDIVNMAGTVFPECKFIQPKFHKVLFRESVTLFKSKIWNSINFFDLNSVSKIIDDLKNKSYLCLEN